MSLGVHHFPWGHAEMSASLHPDRYPLKPAARPEMSAQTDQNQPLSNVINNLGLFRPVIRGHPRTLADIHGQNRPPTGRRLEGVTVGVEEVEDGWRVWFGPLPLAWLDARQVNDPKAKRNSNGKGRWKATFLDSSGRPSGSRRRPTRANGKTRSSPDQYP